MREKRMASTGDVEINVLLGWLRTFNLSTEVGLDVFLVNLDDMLLGWLREAAKKIFFKVPATKAFPPLELSCHIFCPAFIPPLLVAGWLPLEP